MYYTTLGKDDISISLIFTFFDVTYLEVKKVEVFFQFCGLLRISIWTLVGHKCNYATFWPRFKKAFAPVVYRLQRTYETMAGRECRLTPEGTEAIKNQCRRKIRKFGWGKGLICIIGLLKRMFCFWYCQNLGGGRYNILFLFRRPCVRVWRVGSLICFHMVVKILPLKLRASSQKWQL